MMVSVLLTLKSSGILDEVPNLAADVIRGEARPAYSGLSMLRIGAFHWKPPTG